MSHNPINIKEGAFLISDAHFSPRRQDLLEFLKAIQTNKLHPTQLIFMGDIFDVLVGGVNRTYTLNKEVIDLINEISFKIEVIYLEGNHDFNLKNVLNNSKVYTIQKQPLLCEYDGKNIYLAHGDFGIDTSYSLYTSLIRSSAVLFILNVLNILLGDLILKKLDKHLDKKDDCTEIKNFKTIIENRLKDNYKCDYFIEGHFHQNKFIKFSDFNYFNLAAFACNQRYFIVKSSHEELFVEKKFSKGT